MTDHAKAALLSVEKLRAEPRGMVQISA